MSEIQDELLQAIVGRQGDATDEAFGALLGVARPTWSMCRSGKRPMSRALIRRAVALWPDLEPLAVAVLLGRRGVAA